MHRCRFSDRAIWRWWYAVALTAITSGGLAAADRAVISSPGDWSSTLTWSGSAVPGTNDNAFVGGTTPSGALSSATAFLSQDVTTGHVYLGHDSGTNGTLDIGNFTFTAQDLYFGFVGTGAIVRGTGHLDIGHFEIRNSNSFTLGASDLIRNSIDVNSGATLKLNANLGVSADIDLRDNGTVLNAQGFTIQANQFLLGWNNTGTPTLQNRSNLIANHLLVRGQDFQLTSSDTVGEFILRQGNTSLGGGVAIGTLDVRDAATATTSETGNISTAVTVRDGGKITLGANLTIANNLDIRGAGSILDAAGKDITTNNQILLGWNDPGNPTLLNRGKLTANELLVRNQSFQLNPTDAINNFYVDNASTNLGSGVAIQRLILTTNATATTASAGNITKSVTLQTGSSLTMNNNLTLSENLNLSGAGTVLNANGHTISTPNQFLFGWDSTGTPVVQNVGRVNVGELLMNNGTQLTLASGQDSLGRLYLHGNSRLTAASFGGTGVTLTRTAASELQIEAGSHLTLTIDGNQTGWVFRWANPTGADHVADLNTLIGQGGIDFSFANNGGYSLSSNPNGYTYVLVSPVPEPTAILGATAGALALGSVIKRRRKPLPV